MRSEPCQGQAEFAAEPVHPGDEPRQRLLALGPLKAIAERLAERHGRVVARGEHQSVEQVLDPDLLSRADAGRRTDRLVGAL